MKIHKLLKFPPNFPIDVRKQSYFCQLINETLFFYNDEIVNI